jgi:uncharacterized protein (DUF1697 family)
MPRYVAFLRAINVGRRRVKMADLRERFVELGFTNVDTFIASGNVIFDTPSRAVRTLTSTIESHLETSFGFDVAAMLRSPSEIAHVIDGAEERDGHALHAIFLDREAMPDERARIIALNNDVDCFSVGDRVLYWWCRGGAGVSTVSGPTLERAAGMRGTGRSIKSLRRLLEKVQPS